MQLGPLRFGSVYKIKDVLIHDAQTREYMYAGGTTGTEGFPYEAVQLAKTRGLTVDYFAKHPERLFSKDLFWLVDDADGDHATQFAQQTAPHTEPGRRIWEKLEKMLDEPDSPEKKQQLKTAFAEISEMGRQVGLIEDSFIPQAKPVYLDIFVNKNPNGYPDRDQFADYQLRPANE